MEVIRRSKLTDVEHAVNLPLTDEQVEELSHKLRRRVQKICPELTTSQRLFLATGITEEELALSEKVAEQQRNSRASDRTASELNRSIAVLTSDGITELTERSSLSELGQGIDILCERQEEAMSSLREIWTKHEDKRSYNSQAEDLVGLENALCQAEGWLTRRICEGGEYYKPIIVDTVDGIQEFHFNEITHQLQELLRDGLISRQAAHKLEIWEDLAVKDLCVLDNDELPDYCRAAEPAYTACEDRAFLDSIDDMEKEYRAVQDMPAAWHRGSDDIDPDFVPVDVTPDDVRDLMPVGIVREPESVSDSSLVIIQIRGVKKHLSEHSSHAELLEAIDYVERTKWTLRFIEPDYLSEDDIRLLEFPVQQVHGWVEKKVRLLEEYYKPFRIWSLEGSKRYSPKGSLEELEELVSSPELLSKLSRIDAYKACLWLEDKRKMLLDGQEVNAAADIDRFECVQCELGESRRLNARFKINMLTDYGQYICVDEFTPLETLQWFQEEARDSDWMMTDEHRTRLDTLVERGLRDGSKKQGNQHISFDWPRERDTDSNSWLPHRTVIDLHLPKQARPIETELDFQPLVVLNAICDGVRDGQWNLTAADDRILQEQIQQRIQERRLLSVEKWAQKESQRYEASGDQVPECLASLLRPDREKKRSAEDIEIYSPALVKPVPSNLHNDLSWGVDMNKDNEIEVRGTAGDTKKYSQESTVEDLILLRHNSRNGHYRLPPQDLQRLNRWIEVKAPRVSPNRELPSKETDKDTKWPDR